MASPAHAWTFEKSQQWYRHVRIHTASTSVGLNCVSSDDTVVRVRPFTDNRYPTRPLDSASLAFVEPYAHTMAYALLPYVLGKVPKEQLHQATQEDTRCCVWGIFDAHLLPYAWQRGFKASLVPLDPRPKHDPVLNTERPKLFRLEHRDGKVPPFFVLAVFPGKDYVYHYGRLVHQVLELMRRGSAHTLLEVRRFPEIESSLEQWTGLEHVPVKLGDVVILGHVRHYAERLVLLDAKSACPIFRTSGWTLSSMFSSAEARMSQILAEQERILNDALCNGQDFYERLKVEQPSLDFQNFLWLSLPFYAECTRSHKLPSAPTRVLLLGAQYSYWGDICRFVARSLFRKTHYVIYAAKCGTMLSAKKIESIVAPHEYILVEEPDDSPECQAKMLVHRGQIFMFNFPTLVAEWQGKDVCVLGAHVSVPTLVGETYVQRHLIEKVAETSFSVRERGKRVCRGLSFEQARLMRMESRVENPEEANALIAHYAYRYLHYDLAKKMLHISDNDKSSFPPLLSIDNETVWFPVEAARAKEADGCYRYFQAIHRTTDYVRNVRDAATISGDDLAKQRKTQRQHLLNITVDLIRQLLVAFCGFADPSTGAPGSLQVSVGSTTPTPSTVDGRLHWGILSTAQIAGKFLAAISESFSSTLVAIASRDLEKAERFKNGLADPDSLTKSKGSIACYGDYHALLRDRRVTAVYIPLPNDMHAQFAVEAMKAGKHVLVEKPAALTVVEARQMFNESKLNNVHIAEGMGFLYLPLMKRIATLISSRAIGDIVNFETTYSHPIAAREETCAMHPERYGGALTSLGCYMVAAIMDLLPRALPEEAEVAEYKDGVDLQFNSTFKSDGIPARFSCSIAADAPKTQQIRIQGTEGWIQVSSPFHPKPGEPMELILTTQAGLEVISLPYCDPFQAELQDFEDVVIRGAAPAVPFTATLRNTFVLEHLVILSEGLGPSFSNSPRAKK